ncbi:MAG: hypothetical protein Q9181_002062 [Wetmoreana brouardii]
MADTPVVQNTTSQPPEASKDDRPAVLIVGGLGYIGRFLALHLHQNNLACSIRLVDKVLPQLARLAPEFLEACSTSNFMQADASREQKNTPTFSIAAAKPATPKKTPSTAPAPSTSPSTSPANAPAAKPPPSSNSALDRSTSPHPPPPSNRAAAKKTLRRNPGRNSRNTNSSLKKNLKNYEGPKN